MKLQELRVGNIIYYNESEITKVTIAEFVHVLRFIEKYKPIPITDEILLKCGFEKLPITNYRTEEVFKVGKRYLYFNKFEKVWYLNYDDHVPYCNNIQPIKYLHELQNTYYFTSKDSIYEDREELEINL